MQQKHLLKAVGFAALMTLSISAIHAQDKIPVRWFVGLGGGTDAGLIEKQQAVVDEYNASQSEIQLTLEVIANAQAYDVLNTEIAAAMPGYRWPDGYSWSRVLPWRLAGSCSSRQINKLRSERFRSGPG